MKQRVGPYRAVKKLSRDKRHALFALLRSDYAHTKTENEKEFLEMLSRSKLSILRICLLLTDRDPDSIRDLYQEIVCALWEAWPDFRGESNSDTWVRRIAINVAAAQVRHHKHIPTFIPLEGWMYDTIADNVTVAPPDYLLLLDQLDPEDVAFLYLRCDHFSMKEIAETLSISEVASKQRLYRIRKRIDNLKQRLDDNE